MPSAPPPASPAAIAGTRHAATVVVAREAEDGGPVEIFCVKRHARSGFMGGAVVFPGGKLDDNDLAEGWSHASTPMQGRAVELGPGTALGRGLAVAALRETLEEAAIVPLSPRDPTADEVLRLRNTLAGGPGGQTLLAALAAQGLRLDTARLAALGRWVTPKAEPRRYDTRFYLLAAPGGQEGVHDEHETTASFWAPAQMTLARWERGELMLAPPTAFILELFASARSLQEAFVIAGCQSLAAVEPCFVQEADSTVLTLPGDPLHPTPGLAPIAPGGPTRFVFEGGRLVPRAIP